MERAAENGGDVTFKSFDDLESAFAKEVSSDLFFLIFADVDPQRYTS